MKSSLCINPRTLFKIFLKDGSTHTSDKYFASDYYSDVCKMVAHASKKYFKPDYYFDACKMRARW